MKGILKAWNPNYYESKCKFNQLCQYVSISIRNIKKLCNNLGNKKDKPYVTFDKVEIEKIPNRHEICFELIAGLEEQIEQLWSIEIGNSNLFNCKSIIINNNAKLLLAIEFCYKSYIKQLAYQLINKEQKDNNLLNLLNKKEKLAEIVKWCICDIQINDLELLF